MIQPLVACLKPTIPSRERFWPRAIRSWRAQTYEPKVLIIGIAEDPLYLHDQVLGDPRIYLVRTTSGATLGRHRNQVCEAAVSLGATVAAHFDDDDWSHPDRLAEQVAELQASDRHCVGYRQGLFFEEQSSTAWTYYNGNLCYCLGATICYWLHAWQRVKFPELDRGEDWAFIREVDAVGMVAKEPRFIGGVHAANAERYPLERQAVESPQQWRRAAEWDEFARETMKL